MEKSIIINHVRKKWEEQSNELEGFKMTADGWTPKGEKMEKEEGKPELTIQETENGDYIVVRNAGPAGKVFQFRESEFIRVVPANEFVGTYNDPAIARSPQEAIKKGVKSYIYNKVLVPKDETDTIVSRVKTHFPRILKMVEQGRLKKRR